MFEKVIGEQHMKVNKWILIAMLISMLMAPYTGNMVVRILALSVIVIAFVNAIVIGYKVIKYYYKKRE